MRPKILLIEDDIALQTTIKEYLEPAYYVVAVQRAQDAVKRLQDTHFKALLVDLGLPDTSGVKIMTLANKRHPKTAILTLTSDTSPESVQKAIAAGADDYLVKPVEPEHLKDRIEKAALKRTVKAANK